MKKIINFIKKITIKFWTWLKKTFFIIKDKPGTATVISSVSSIVFGLVVGIILLLIFNADAAGMGLNAMLGEAFKTKYNFVKVLSNATPLIMTGLAVGFAFKTGLFNIGASGQYLMGAFFGLFTAIVWQFPWYLALITSIIGGAIWGAIPGIFKAFFNVNEVITAIMFNWIGLFLVNMLIKNTPAMFGSTSERTISLAIANSNALIPSWGLDKLFGSDSMNIGIIIAILVAISMHIIINKTTFGFELKACGYNKNAAKYAGIKDKKNIILAMTISGALAGLGGGLFYLTGTRQYVIANALESMGFNGIPVALLASSSPIGTIFSGFFIAYIQFGGTYMQPEFTSEIISIIIAVIIYLSAFSLLFKNLISKYILNVNLNKTIELTNKGSDNK